MSPQRRSGSHVGVGRMSSAGQHSMSGSARGPAADDALDLHRQLDVEIRRLDAAAWGTVKHGDAHAPVVPAVLWGRASCLTLLAAWFVLMWCGVVQCEEWLGLGLGEYLRAVWCQGLALHFSAALIRV